VRRIRKEYAKNTHSDEDHHITGNTDSTDKSLIHSKHIQTIINTHSNYILHSIVDWSSVNIRLTDMVTRTGGD
ncbi:26338_t:CDS:1, partial [Racocetra persica]